jgi:hypothetical protein
MRLTMTIEMDVTQKGLDDLKREYDVLTNEELVARMTEEMNQDMSELREDITGGSVKIELT